MDSRDFSAARDDLAFVKSVIEEGRTLPTRGGRFAVLWGTYAAVASILHWMVVVDIFALGQWAIPVIWFGGGALAGFISALMQRQLKAKGGTMTMGSAVERTVWTVSGLFFFLFAFGLFMITTLEAAGVTHRLPYPSLGFAFFPPVAFGIYAIAQATAARAARRKAYSAAVIACFAFMLATLALVGTHYQLLVSGVGIIAVLVIPGMALLRAEKSGQ